MNIYRAMTTINDMHNLIRTIKSYRERHKGEVMSDTQLAPYISSWYEIKDSGLYAINIPTSNNETVNVVHAYVYENTEYSW